MEARKLFNEISEIETELDILKCCQCNNDLEYFGIFDGIAEVYENYGSDGLFGDDGYLTEIPDTECDTCYFFTPISKISYNKIVQKAKKILEKK